VPVLQTSSSHIIITLYATLWAKLCERMLLCCRFGYLCANGTAWPGTAWPVFAESYLSLSGLCTSTQTLTIVPPTPLQRAETSLITYLEEFCCFKAERIQMLWPRSTVNRSCLDSSRHRLRVMYKRYTTKCA
jgi:hypothetical protein